MFSFEMNLTPYTDHLIPPRDAVLAHFHETRSENELVIDTSRIPQAAVREVEPSEWEYLLQQLTPPSEGHTP